jgi:hypothetical protein
MDIKATAAITLFIFFSCSLVPKMN